MAGSTLVDINQLKALVKHPKWVWVEGLLCFPEFKPTQKVRSHCGKNELWLPDFKDTVTLAYLHHIYALNGGSIKREGEVWVSTHEVMGNDLADVLIESILKL